jgi:hypothetical protein
MRRKEEFESFAFVNEDSEQHWAWLIRSYT